MNKGWKNLNKNMTCNGFKFEIEKWYKHDGEIELCQSGFHFHKQPIDLFRYYEKDLDTTLVAEIEYRGKCLDRDDKSVCEEIRIIRVLDKEEVRQVCNLVENSGFHCLNAPPLLLASFSRSMISSKSPTAVSPSAALAV